MDGKFPPGALFPVSGISHITDDLSCLYLCPLFHPLRIAVQMGIVEVSAVGSPNPQAVSAQLQPSFLLHHTIAGADHGKISPFFIGRHNIGALMVSLPAKGARSAPGIIKRQGLLPRRILLDRKTPDIG